MPSKLIAGSVWGHIKSLSRKRNGAVMAAAPYFGRGATELLKLRKGNILVVKFDRETIGSGQVDPREVIKAITNGVEVHSCSNLHAKIFLFGNKAIIGSANVSNHSDKFLLEACVETTDKKVVSKAKQFVHGLLGDRIGLDFAKEMVSFYRPPKHPMNGIPRTTIKRKRTPVHSDLWFVSLVEKSWQDVDYEQEDKGWDPAQKEIKNPRAFELEDFQWSGGSMPSRFKMGQRVIQCTKTAKGNVLVSPPSRIVSVRRYKVKQQLRAIVFVESPKKHRRRQLSAVIRSLGQHAKYLGNPRRTKQLRNPELIEPHKTPGSCRGM